jgi:hypothetical protein
MTTKFLFHFHTTYSDDGCITPQAAVEFALANNIGLLAPTDHDTIRGSLEIKKLADGHGIRVIIGAEYSSECGDIIGLFLKEEVIARDSKEIIREIKGQGGMVVLPHPYRSHQLSEWLLNSVDAVETFNARLSKELNDRATELAQRLRLPQFVGSDAHLVRELGLAIGEIDESPNQSLQEILRAGIRPVVTRQTQLADIYRSQMVKAARRGRPLLWAKSLVRMIMTSIGSQRQ